MPQDPNVEEKAIDTLRQMVVHEDEQMHRRLTWLSSFQGFLFAGLALAWGKAPPLVLIISMVGLTVALLVFVGMLAAALAVLDLHTQWLNVRSEEKQGPGVFGFFPSQARWTVFTSPEVLIPLVFAVAWCAVLWVR